MGPESDSVLTRTALVGGEGGGEFTHPSPTGRPVVGFQYAFGNWDNRQVLRQLEPVFDPDDPDIKPNKPDHDHALKTIMARSGYVVGGLIVDRDNVNACAVRVMFVAFKEGRVAPSQTYTSDWIGIPSGIHQEQIAGKGETVVGTYGRQGLNLNAVGLLVGTDVKKTAAVGSDGGEPLTVTGPPGSPVIGFRYNLGDWGRRCLRTLEPVYRDGPAAPSRAHLIGGEELQTLTARDGYVVTGLLADFDETNACAVQVHFARLKNGAPDPLDAYNSDWVGVPSNIHREELKGGPGTLVIGTYGRKGLNLNKLGLLVGAPAPAATTKSAAPTTTGAATGKAGR